MPGASKGTPTGHTPGHPSKENTNERTSYRLHDRTVQYSAAGCRGRRSGHGSPAVYGFNIRHERTRSVFSARLDRCSSTATSSSASATPPRRRAPTVRAAPLSNTTCNGNVVKTYSVVGHNDGLRVDPQTKQLWAMQNEDEQPESGDHRPRQRKPKAYTFGPTPHGGGYDDIAFRGRTCSSARRIQPTTRISLRPLFALNSAAASSTLARCCLARAGATDIPTDTPVTLNLQDPDSMMFDPFGDLVLDSQADGELIIVHHPGAFDQSVYHLALTLNGASVQIDDTIYATGLARGDSGFRSGLRKPFTPSPRTSSLPEPRTPPRQLPWGD